MKIVSVLLTSLLLFSNAFASTVVIDFQDVAVGTSGSITSRGFNFSGGSQPIPPIVQFELLSGTDPNRVLNTCYSFTACEYQAGHPEPAFPWGTPPAIEFSKQDSSLFDLISFQMASDGCLCDLPASVTGYFADGSSISKSFSMGEVTLKTITLGTGWTNLKSVEIFGATYHDYTTVSLEADMRLDNITISAVPVPAAVWLFASGLGLLGRLRRRPAA